MLLYKYYILQRKFLLEFKAEKNEIHKLASLIVVITH